MDTDTEAWPDRYNHPKVSLAFTDAIMNAKEGKIVGVLGNFLRGPKIRQRYEEALSTPVMVLNRPIQKGKKIEYPEFIEFYGGTGKFRGKQTIFISNLYENELVKTLLHEGAHVVFSLRGMSFPPSDLGSVTGRSEYFKAEKEKMVDSFVDEAWLEPEDEITHNPLGKKPKPDRHYDPAELARGVDVEMEHTDDPEIAKVIAKDHLDEDPHYYARLLEAGITHNPQATYDDPEFYISSGLSDAMYTLRARWYENVGYGPALRDRYTITLTADPQTSLEKANAWLAEHGHPPLTEVPGFTLRAITRSDDWSVMRGGKYSGMTVDELVQTDPGYALWAALNLSGKKFDKTVALLREALGERYLAAKAESDARARGLARLSEQKSEVNVMRIELLRPLAERMQDGKGGFRDSIAEDLGKGELPRGRGLTLTMEILAKQAGRKGSKGYNEEFERIDAIVGQVENLESGGVESNPLIVTQVQREWLKDNKATAFINMDPMDFLTLTTPDSQYLQEILNKARTLDEYNEYQIRTKEGQTPLLRIEKETGKITGHEGRHRAAAVYNAGESAMKVGIRLVHDYAGSRSWTWDDVPEIWHGEFDDGKVYHKQHAEVIEPRIQHVALASWSDAATASNPPEGWFVRLTRSDGMGLLNRQAFDTDLLDDDEDQELLELRTYGFQHPVDVPQGAVFAFTPEGLERNQRLIELLTKAAENDVDQQWLDPDDYEVIWESRDGQVALLPLYEDEE